MKKTLIVKHTPRIDSNTLKLVDYFIELNKNKTEITILDISENPPDLLLGETLNLYINRNFNGVDLTKEQMKTLAKNDKMAQQVLDSDFIVLAYPVYNFSLPANVKSWIDAVAQAGVTFTMTKNGYKGLCDEKQALVLTTSGGDFNIEPLKSMDFASPLIKTCFKFLGIEMHQVSAFGLQQYSDKLSSILDDANQKILQISKKWYQ
ncbi:MAG: hypothetical protein Wins2KO_22710 [Winogradskyella sp.]